MAGELWGLEGLDRFTNRRELDALKPVLTPGEEVRYALDGLNSGRRGLLAATDSRILFLTKALLRRRVQQWDYDDVEGLAVQKAVDDATMTFQMRDGDFVVTGARKAAAEAFRNAIRLSIADRTFRRARAVSEPRQADPVPEGNSTADRLRRLDRMRERRSITEPEYKVNRRRILEDAGLPTDLRKRSL